MYLTNSLRNFITFLIGFSLVFITWIFLGLRPTTIIGLNDISHHLTTLLIGNQKNPFFSPIYDWLWMGGQLVAPNVGNIPLERFLISLGVSFADALSITIVFFQATIFYFSFTLLDDELKFSATNIIASLAIAFLPTITLRIIYGHLSLFIPVLFNLIFIWVLSSSKRSLFSILLAIFTFIHLFSGPYFQIIFYSIILTWPLILYYRHKEFTKNIFFLTWIFLTAFLFNLDFVFMIYKYISNGDLFRDSHSGNLIYSYAKLKLDNFVDLLTYEFINLEDLPFFLAHEIKAFVGVVPFLFLVNQRLSFKKHFLIYLFSTLILFFIFCPPNFEFIFYKIPFLNMFRIPQRVVLCFIVPIYLMIFLTLKKRRDSNKYISLLSVILCLIFGFFSLTSLDFFLFAMAVVFIFPTKKFSISLKTFAAVFFICNFFFLFHHPQKTSSKFVFDYPKDRMTIKRDRTYDSIFWTINTSRVLGVNSIYGYTHPLPKYRELFTKTFNVNIIDLLYFKELPAHHLNQNFKSLYRYNNSSSLSYSPLFVTSDYDSFWNEFNVPRGATYKNEMALVPKELSLFNQGPCLDNIIVSNEVISATNTYSFNVVNQTNNQCIVIVPFNYSHFLSAYINNNPTKLFPANISQMAILIGPGYNSVEIRVDNTIFWNLKYAGIFLGLLCFFTHYYYRRRDLF